MAKKVTAKKRKDGGSCPIPPDFVKQMETLLGMEEAAALVEAIEGSPSVSIRLNRKKVTEPETFMKRFESFRPSAVPWCDSGYYLETRPDFIHDPLLHAGVYYVQEAASMVYEEIVADIMSSIAADKETPVRVLDLCAAPGGKSTAMLNALTGDYLLVANEHDRKRAGILKENLDKWGDPNVIVTNSPTDRFAALDPLFDIVAVDAPCSGEGMMRREPVARSQWNHGLVESCSLLQRKILADAIECLKTGGFLIYSTCTFNRSENEDNVKWLSENFRLKKINEGRHFYPHRHRCEGLFVAVFQKLPPFSDEEGFDDSGRVLGNDSPYPGREALLRALKEERINILSSSTELTVKKGDMEIPSSRRVLAHDYDHSFPEVELSGQDALNYLKRNALRLPEDTPLGFVAVTYQGYPLGLVKNLGSRANNLYPAEWRVLN